MTHDSQPQGAGGLTAGRDLDELRKSDAEITAALKGPMSNLERALLVADRKDIRTAISLAQTGEKP